jgi:hypothetical protein
MTPACPSRLAGHAVAGVLCVTSVSHLHIAGCQVMVLYPLRTRRRLRESADADRRFRSFLLCLEARGMRALTGVGHGFGLG